MSRKLVCDNCDAYITPESRYTKLAYLKYNGFTANQGADPSIDLCPVCTAAVNKALTAAKPHLGAKPVDGWAKPLDGFGTLPGERPVHL